MSKQGAAVKKDNEKVERDLENLFEAEVEYVLDELQGKAHKLLEESGKGYECAAGFGTRLAGLVSDHRSDELWLQEMGEVVLQVMAVMEDRGCKLSEEILEILARESTEKGSDFREGKLRIIN